jgi:hypothetical protein
MMRILTFLLGLIILSSVQSAQARSWDDLNEGETKVFGSEKEKKYPVNTPIYEHELWENHESRWVLGVYKSVNYPKYRSLRIFPFYYGLDSKIDNRSWSFCPLLLAYGEIDRNERFRINPLFIDYRRDRTPESSSYERVTLSLLHGYVTESWKDQDDTIVWAPIVPLFYRHTDGSGGHQNLLWLIDYAWDSEKGKDRLTRFWFFPLFMHSVGSDGYTVALPPVFVWNRHTNGEKWMHLLPLFVHDKSIETSYSGKEKTVTAENTFLSLFYCSLIESKGDWDGEKLKVSRWFPLIPFVYWHSQYGVEYHRNIAWLFDWHNDANNLTDRFWAAPAFFWKKDAYTHILPPLYMSFRDSELSSAYVLPPLGINRVYANGERYTHALPFFAWNKTIEERGAGQQIFTDTKISLAGFYSAESKSSFEGETLRRTMGFPILPLYYSYTHYGVESHRNLLWLFDWHNDRDNLTDRFWAAPAFFWKKDAYMHILPPVYMSFSDSSSSYSHVFPLGFRYRVTTQKIADDSLYSVFGGYSSERENASGELLRRSWWFPFLPVIVYHSYDRDEGSSTRILVLLNFKGGKKGESSRFSFFPLVHYDGAEGGARYFFPYYRPAGWTEEHGWSIAPPLYYHRWNREEDVLWSALVHYRRDNSAANEHVNLWAPLWYTKSTPEWEISSKFIGYFYYNNPKDKYFTRVVAPFYWNFDTPKRETTLFLPLYFSTQRIDGTGKLHINILGGSASLLAGTNPLASVSTGFNERGIYFDTDVSWLYNMFSIGKRTTIPLSKTPFASALPESIDENTPNEEEYKVALSDKTNIKRETSISYFGLDLFYGLIAYRHVDTKHHFRFLPLSYLTWDDTSENRIKWIGNWISYKDEASDTEYLAVVPFYGSQRVGESHREGYILNAFWNEYTAERRETERTVLWPLFNWYSSPSRSGWRALPILTWHKWRAEDYGSYHRTIILPLLSFHSGTDDYDGETLSSFFINPLFYRNYTSSDTDTGTDIHERWNTLLPLAGFRSSETTRTSLLPAKDAQQPALSQQNHSSSHAWGFPFYYAYKDLYADSGTGYSSQTLLRIVLPLYFNYSSTTASQGISDDGSGTKLFVIAPAFVPIYVSASSGGSWTKGYGANLYWKEYDADTQTTETSILWPLFNRYTSPGASGWRIFPFVWHKYNRTDDFEYRRNIIAPLLSYQSRLTSNSGEVRSHFMINPLFYYNYENTNEERSLGWNATLPFIGYRTTESSTKEAAADGGAQTISSRGSTRYWCFPFIHSYEEHSVQGRDGSAVSEKTMFGPLFYYHAMTLGSGSSIQKDSTIFLLGYYAQNTTSGPVQWSFFGGLLASSSRDGTSTKKALWGLGKSETRPDGRTVYFHPFWYYDRDDRRTNFYLTFGLFHYMRDRATGEADTSLAWWLFNTSVHNEQLYTSGGMRPARERTTWFLPFFYYNNGKTTDAAPAERYATFFAPVVPLFYYHSSSEGTHINAGLLFDMGISGSSTHVWVMPLWFSRTGAEGYCHFLPLWYHRWDDAAGKSIWATPLSYSSTSGRGTAFEETTRWFPVIPLVYTNTTRGWFHLNALGVFDYSRDDDRTRCWFFPLLFAKSGSSGYFHILPLYLSSWDDSSGDSWSCTLGFYQRTNPSYKRRNFLWLADYISKPQEQFTGFSLAFGSLNYEISPEVRSMRAVWGLLADADFSRKNDDYNVRGLLYLAAVKKYGDEFHHRLLPFWYYSSSRDGYTLVVPPALTYLTTSGDGSTRQFVGLGVLWARWCDPADKYDTRLALGGLPYYRFQRAERGFSSEGSVWGLLWKHEAETETGYEKFSVLAGLYKKVTIEGETYSSVFGIRL